MKRFITLALLLSVLAPLWAQHFLTLDSCRALALRNNKQLNISRLNQQVAAYIRKSTRTKYLPKVDALGSYQYMSREISLLSDGQKNSLNNAGTHLAGAAGKSLQHVGGQVSTGLQQLLSSLAQQGAITPQMAQALGQQFSQHLGIIGQQLSGTLGQQLGQWGNALGQELTNSLRTDTKQIWSGAIMVRQPIFMGGAITAANKMADLGITMAANDLDLKQQNTLYNIDQAYWLVVSLRQKQQLAHSYRDLVQQLDNDVYKMIHQGVATKAQGLRVDVKVNEADMKITQAEDGLTLSKMLLCQLCGLPMESDITLADEQQGASIELPPYAIKASTDTITNQRPELRMLQTAVNLSRQNTRLIRAAYLPHVALTGGYLVSNPNVYNGFQRKFSGVWNVGITLQVPVWNWQEGTYKVRAAKAATNIAQMELNDALEKIQLQVSQSRFKVKEAEKRYAMAQKNMKSAEENLRCANIGFREGVMEITDVMAAQTAWQEAESQRIDAQIDVRMSRIALDKALGTLQITTY